MTGCTCPGWDCCCGNVSIPEPTPEIHALLREARESAPPCGDEMCDGTCYECALSDGVVGS